MGLLSQLRPGSSNTEPLVRTGRNLIALWTNLFHNAEREPVNWSNNAGRPTIPYSAISTARVTGPASGRSSMAIMLNAETASITVAAANT